MYKILIVEDELEMQKLLVKYIELENPDLEVVGHVDNGLKALEVIEKCSPDIIITDICMPGMNGIELLKEINKRKISIKAIIISGYDEFEYAKSAITLGVMDYLLKPFDPDELKTVLEKVQEELGKQKILFNNMELLKENINSKNLLLKEETLLKIIFSKEDIGEPSPSILNIKDTYYCVCILKIPLHIIKNDFNFDNKVNAEDLIDFLWNGYFHEDIHLHVLNHKKQKIILILTGDGQSKQQFISRIEDGMKDFQQSLKKYYNLQLICVIGGVYESWKKLKDSYKDAVNAWKSLISSDKNIIVSSHVQDVILKSQEKEYEEYYNQIKSLNEQIILSICMSYEKKYMEYLEEIIQVYTFLLPEKADYVSVSAQKLIYDIFNEVEKNGVKFDENQKNEDMQKNIIEQLNHASLLEIKEILMYFINVCHKSFIEQKIKNQSELIVENVKYLIECNLALENLTLGWLAEKLHFSPTYVRKVFKEDTGERVMEYVIRKRMEKARNLLLKTDIMIQDVALACGYSNQRYFASSFKKHYSCTPTNFREMVKKSDEKREDRKEEYQR